MMSCHKNEIRIVYWNANGIQNKIHELYNFMLVNFVDVSCVCETFLKSHHLLPAHPQFTIYRHDRDDNIRKGGVLIIVRKSVPHQLLSNIQCSLVENIGIEIATTNSKIQFISCYLPGGSNNQQIRNLFLNDLRQLTHRGNFRHCPNYYALGDFNSKHRFWGCHRANLAGNILYNEFNQSNFDIIYPLDHSYHPSDANRSSSTPDIGLTNCS